jgi:hypothetical protein
MGKALPAIVFFALASIVPLVAALKSWWEADPRKLRRVLSKAPRVSIAEACEGEAVRLDGRVADGETLIAPLTGRRCVFYVAVIEEAPAKLGGDWAELARETRGVPFTVDDGTGRLIVDPAEAQIDVVLDSDTASGPLNDPDAIEVAFLKRHNVKSTGWLFNRSLRYREGVFEIGEPIAVMCCPIRELDPDAASHATGGYRDAAPTRLRVGGSPEHPILLSDASVITGAR